MALRFPEREMVLDYRVRWLGMVPAVCFAFHFIYNAWGVERPANLLWMCHVTAFLLAVGLIGSFAGLVRLVAPWTLLGLPIWLVDAVVLGTTTRISVLSHLLVPLTAIVAMSQVGAGRSPVKEAVKAFAFYIGLVGLSRLVTPPDFNVNLAYRIYPFFGADVVSSYSAYFFITGVAIFVCLFGLSVLFKRRFPPLSLDALAAAAESGRDVAVKEDGSIAEVKTPRPRPPPPKKSFNTIRGAAVDPRTIQSLDEELPVEDPMTSSTREEPGRPASEKTRQLDWIPPKLRARGFSLLEMMVVVSVLGILAAIAVPDLSPAIHNARLRGSADEVASFLERARRNARAEGRCHRVTVQNGGKTMVMERRQHSDCMDGASLNAGWTEVARSQTPVPTARFALESSVAAGQPGGDAIIFRPNGRLRGNGDNNLQNDGGRIYITYPEMGSVGMNLVVTPFGRVCGFRVPTRPPALGVNEGTNCVAGFINGGAALDGGSAPSGSFSSGGGSSGGGSSGGGSSGGGSSGGGSSGGGSSGGGSSGGGGFGGGSFC